MNSDFSRDFGPFNGRIWLNCSHQGPLPYAAVTEAFEAVSWKQAPYHLASPGRFDETPSRLRNALGKLVGVPAEDIILGNSASYGLHLLANAIPWKEGDEVLLVRGDFPSDILPWLGLEKRGVRIRLIEPRAHVLSPEELEAHISPASRLLCTTWVHSFSGYAVDAQALGQICRANGIIFFLNCSQALGARQLDLATVPLDAITSVGFKWLCGPYGTGFCWIKPDLRETLEYNQAYWLAMQTADDLGKEQKEVIVRTDLGARKYDVFGTANFFNFKPWAAAVEYLLAQGIERIEAHDNMLVSRLIEGLDPDLYELVSPREGSKRSSIVVITHKAPARNQEIHKSLVSKQIFTSFRSGNLRISPHLYNTPEEIYHLLAALNSER